MTDINTAFRALLSILHPSYHSANASKLGRTLKLLETVGWTRNYAYLNGEDRKKGGVRVKPEFAATIPWMAKEGTIVAYDLVTALRANEILQDPKVSQADHIEAYRTLTSFNVSCRTVEPVLHLLKAAISHENKMYHTGQFGTPSLNGGVELLVNPEEVRVKHASAVDTIQGLVDLENQEIQEIDRQIAQLTKNLNLRRAEALNRRDAYLKTLERLTQ